MKNSMMMSISRCEKLQTSYGRFKKRVFPIVILILFLCVPYTVGTPPNYKSFKRDQRTNHQINPDDLMRIWIVYVGQGDGILIQLPPKCNYDPDSADNVTSRTETVDIMIDGGSHSPQNETIMENFLLGLYDAPAIIEHAVITHHDGDHVKGLIRILTGNSIGIESIYHNGLASYRRGKRNFSDSTTAKEAVRDISSGHLVRGMAFLDPDDDDQGKKLRESYLINTKQALRQRFNNDEFQGVYNELANAVLDEEDPIEVSAFQRCVENGSFIEERESQLNRGADLSGIEFRLIWPLQRARKYGGWSETINGNSVTFRLDYGDFSMLFTGDHNEKSEEKLIEHLNDTYESDLLSVDVLKVPHHGSWHGYETFFRNIGPVLSVASMGPRGFTTSWRHPSNEVIKWLGGSHRVYHTFIHEKRFNWSDLQTIEDREQMHERSHILIETDGERFRIVEVDAEDGDLISPPTVRQTRRSNGTQWIRTE
jgi:beta-lactamase superfamily II metal-dependent hydrolase